MTKKKYFEQLKTIVLRGFMMVYIVIVIMPLINIYYIFLYIPLFLITPLYNERLEKQ